MWKEFAGGARLHNVNEQCVLGLLNSSVRVPMKLVASYTKCNFIVQNLPLSVALVSRSINKSLIKL